MKRFFLFVLIFMVVCSIPLGVYADEVEAEVTTAVTTVVTTADVVEVDKSAEDSTDTWVTEVSAALENFLPEALSATTVIGLIAVAISLKRKLVPAIVEAVTALRKLFTETSAENKAENAALRAKYDALLEKVEGIVDGAEKGQKTVADEVALIAESSSELCECIVALLANSNIPTDVKEKVTALYSEHEVKIKALLGDSNEE